MNQEAKESMKKGITWAGVAGALVGATALPLVAGSKLAHPQVRTSAGFERLPSYWTLTAPNLPVFPRLGTDIEVDIAVIGGGFAGLASAYYLKALQPERSVAVFEAHRLGSGASSRNSGAIVPRLRGHDASGEAARGYERFKRFIAEEQLDIDFQEEQPTLLLARDPTPDVGLSLNRAQLSEVIGSRCYTGAATTATTSVHPGKLIAGLVQANIRRGVDFYEMTPVLAIERGAPHVFRTPSARVRARDVVIATNAYTPQLGIAGELIAALHQQVLVTRPLTDAEWQTSGLGDWPFRFETGDHYTHTVRRTADRRFFFRHALGHRAFERTDWLNDRGALALGQREMLRRYPWLTGVPIDYRWHGVVAQTRDWWPVGGQIDEHLYIAAGFNGSGIMAAHYFGYLLAHLIAGMETEDQEMLRPSAGRPSFPGELARHVAFQSWFRYQALRDEGGRGPAISLWTSDRAAPTSQSDPRHALSGSPR